MTATLRSTLAFTILAALLFYAVGSVAEAQQKRIDQINQEQLHGHRTFNR